MCGILGGTIRDWDYQKGIESIKHRGPDDGRIETVDGVTLAFVRLAVQDLTAAGMQPMQSGDGQVFLVFNGEIYGYEAVRDELKKKYVFHGNSDTEVILNAYLEWGNSFIEKIDGMFAIAIYDRRSREIKLFRDRTGIKPLYYYVGEEGIAFASELKALENAGKDNRWKIDETAVYDFLFYQYIPDPKTMYRQVRKLKPGYKLTYRLDTRRVDIDRYWRLKVNTTAGRRRKREDVSEELRYLIGKSVRNHLIADVPTGTFLSGGIDYARNIRIALTACDAGSSLRPAAQGGEKMGCWMAAGGWLVHMKNSLSSAFYTISYAEESRRVRREPGAGRLEMRRQSVPEQVKSEKIPCEGGELFFNLPNCPGFSGARFEGFDHFVHLCRFSLAFPQKKG